MMLFYQYRNSHCGDKTIQRPSYLHNEISYSGKTTISYWITAQAVIEKTNQWIDGTLEKQLFAWNKIFDVKLSTSLTHAAFIKLFIVNKPLLKIH